MPTSIFFRRVYSSTGQRERKERNIFLWALAHTHTHTTYSLSLSLSVCEGKEEGIKIIWPISQSDARNGPALGRTFLEGAHLLAHISGREQGHVGCGEAGQSRTGIKTSAKNNKKTSDESGVFRASQRAGVGKGGHYSHRGREEKV